MQFILDLPEALGERLNRFADPNAFIVHALSQTLHLESTTGTTPSRVEDVFGLYKPKRSVTLEEMEEAIVKGALQ